MYYLYMGKKGRKIGKFFFFFDVINNSYMARGM